MRTWSRRLVARPNWNTASWVWANVVGGPFTAIDIDQEIFALNRNDDRELRLFGQPRSLNELPPAARSIDIPLTKTPPTSLELSLEQPDNRFDALEGTATFKVGEGITVGKELGFVNIAGPKIELADDNIADGLTDRGESDFATAKLELGTIVGSALGIGGLLGTTVIDLGIGTIEITTVRFDAGPELALTQDVEVVPTSRLTYEFDSEVEVHINGQHIVDSVGDPDKVTRASFVPGTDDIKVYFRGNPIEVTPLLETNLILRNKVDLELQFGGRLTVGQLDASFFGLDPLTLGPLYSQSFSETIFAHNLFNDRFAIASETRELQSFTIGGNFDLAEDATMVTTTEDVGWTPSKPVISLRQAIRNANFLDQQEIAREKQKLNRVRGDGEDRVNDQDLPNEPNTIYLGAGTYRLTDDIGGDLDIEDRDLTIVGTGNTIIDASEINDRIFDVGDGFGLKLEGVTLRGGTAVDPQHGQDGGAIRNHGSVELRNVNVVNNRADNHGGGVYNAVGATLSVRRGEFRSNYATAEDGGGVSNLGMATFDAVSFIDNSAVFGGGLANGGMAMVTYSSLTGNQVRSGPRQEELGIECSQAICGYGGGIFNRPGAQLFIAATTLSDNRAVHGGGIYVEQEGHLEIRNSTISNNEAQLSGGGARVIGNTDGRIRNTILSGNRVTSSRPTGADDIEGRLTSRGHNLVGDVSVPTDFNAVGDIRDSIPDLLPLGLYGGFTLSHVPNIDSPVLGQGAPDGVVDQRGFQFTDPPEIGSAQYSDLLTVTRFVDDQPSDREEFGELSLRDAIHLANATGPSPKTIELSEGTYEVRINGSDTDRRGDLDIRVPLEIVGAGAERTTIAGIDGRDRVIEVHDTADGVLVSKVTIRGGNAGGLAGGGILNSGDLTLERIIITDNYAEIHGGGIANSGCAAHQQLAG